MDVQKIKLTIAELRCELVGEILEVMKDRERIDFINENGETLAFVAVGFRNQEYNVFPAVDAIVKTKSGIVLQCNVCGEDYEIALVDVELSTDDLAEVACAMYKVLNA